MALVFIALQIADLQAVIFGERPLTIDFTRPDAASQVEWSPTNRYDITAEGLGWDHSATGADFNGGSILTHPVGIGYFWRPVTSVTVKVEVQPGPELITNGKMPFWRRPGKMFVRHSPDLVHWSSWQELQRDSHSNRVFTGRIGIPERERAIYQKLIGDYGRANPSSGSNEEAVVRWITKDKPEFFADNLPFVGHVQLLFEGEFLVGHRFKKLDAKFSYSVGGLHAEPSDPKEQEQFLKDMMEIPWRFDESKKP